VPSWIIIPFLIAASLLAAARMLGVDAIQSQAARIAATKIEM
jgi:hypothetical protein